MPTTDPVVKIFLLFGRSGCGKGTQAELLAKKYNLPVYGGGDLLRERAAKNDFSGRKLKAVLLGGGLAPTSLIYKEWVGKFDAFKDDSGFSGLIFDGSPRKKLEAELLSQAFDWYEWPDVYPVLLEISRQEAENRLMKRRICKTCKNIIPYIGRFKDLEKCDKCGGELERRPDDTEEAIKGRMDYYEKEVVPMLEYYRQESRLLEINGEQVIEKVFADIVKAVEN